MMFRGFKNYLQIILFFLLLNTDRNALAQIGDSRLAPIFDNRYPADAKLANYKQIGNLKDSLKLIHEFDVFLGSNDSVGRIVDMVAYGDNFYFADAKQKVVHVIDKMTLEYKKSILSLMSRQVSRPFGLHLYGENIFIGEGRGPNLFNVLNASSDSLIHYKHNNPPDWPISSEINSSFIVDSVAYVTKLLAHNGKKVIRYSLRGGEANKVNEIIPVSDLHAEVDSAIASKIITRLFLLKSNKVDSLFYALPSNKYLVVSYGLDGRKLESINLRGIPEVDRSIKYLMKYNNSYFPSATIDQMDNIYFPILLVDNPEEALPEETSVAFIAVNLHNKTYRLYDFDPRHVSPLKVIDGKLWCYDYIKSQLVVYSL